MTTFKELSPQLQELLLRVKASQLEGHYDNRGYYAEYDSENCKPYLNTTIIEAQELDWLEIHKDSNHAYEVEEPYIEEFEVEFEDENGKIYYETEEKLVFDSSSGVSFINIKPEYLELVIKD